MELLTKQYNTEKREFDSKERTIVHYITTTAVDEYKEVVKPDGMDDSKFRAVLWNHSYGFSWFDDMTPPPSQLVIGKSLWRKKESGGVLAKTQFADTTLGNDVMKFNAEGLINSWSIGFKTKKKELDEKTGVTTILEWELWEYSSVIFPANPEAVNLMLTGAKDLNIKRVVQQEACTLELRARLKTNEDKLAELSSLVELMKTTDSGERSRTASDLENQIKQIKSELAKRVEIADIKRKHSLTKEDIIRSFAGAISSLTGKKIPINKLTF